ncbi:hypothetical protein [Xanthomonas euroxanthea]|uniref:hypothetical protein n=1 Tax=Xanthomonas euroxanthea TaxID=2259622 RepID=UPI001FD77DE3|nr:hypothetical protein [Xanthomonas euroxanthea]
MQALSMDESRLLPKGRAVYQRTTAFGAFAPNAKVGLIFIAVAIATGYLRGFFALFPGARARTAGPPTGRMFCPIALAMLKNGLPADEAGSEKRGKKPLMWDVPQAVRWNFVAGRAYMRRRRLAAVFQDANAGVQRSATCTDVPLSGTLRDARPATPQRVQATPVG